MEKIWCKQQKHVKWGAKGEEGRLSPDHKTCPETAANPRSPNFWLNKAGEHLMSWSHPRQVTGSLLSLSEGTMLFFVVLWVCVGECCRIWDGLAPLGPCVRQEFSPKKAVGGTHWDALGMLARIWSEVVNFAQLEHTNKCDHVWGASVDGGI